MDKWMEVVRASPSGKSPGLCVRRYEDIQPLPKRCIEFLARIFEKLVDHGMSATLMRAKTVPLAKIDHPTCINHARPITILSCLYRVFARLLFKTVAPRWASVLPLPISGGLPGRGCKDIAYAPKHNVELAIENKSDLGGLSLDLVKAFNTFPRYSIALVMRRLGIKWQIVEFWLLSLSVMSRFPGVKNRFGKPLGATTGAPEGCPISVLSMVALSACYYYTIYTPRVTPYCYADN